MTSWKSSDIPDLTGRVALVTGANAGLGFATATELARHGADLILAVRNTEAGDDAAARIRAAAPGAIVTVRHLDVASLSSVREFSARIAAERERIDLLVNNAGVVSLGPRRTTEDGFELHLGTNALGHFALTGLMLPLLTAAPAARVVSLSSITHKRVRFAFDDLQSERAFQPNRAYGISKLANTVFGIELDRRLRRAGAPVISVLAHPGVSRSNLIAGAWRDRGSIGRALGSLYSAIATQPTAQGVLPQLHAATAPDVEGGTFYGPDGRGERRGQVTAVRATAHAADPEVGRRFWAAAESLTGVRSL